MSIKISCSGFSWIQQVTKTWFQSNTFIDLYSGDDGEENWPFYYPDYYLDERTNSEYNNSFNTLRFGDSPVMREEGIWQAYLTLTGQNDDGTLQVVQTVTYSFTNSSGTINFTRPFIVPTPQFTIDQINQYNQIITGPPFL